MINRNLKLLPEQVEALQKEITSLNEQYNKLIEDAKNEEHFNAGCDLQGITDTFDRSSLEKLSYISKRVNEISNCLNCHELVTEYSKDMIKVGTQFEVFMNFGKGDTEQDTYRLVDNIIGCSSEDKCISLNSPLGAAAYNKKIGDNFCYEIPSGAIVDCVVLDILPEKIIEKAKQKIKK
ncbi:MAG: GreA/GreB family elongation factor [Bacilli bacterium]|nr:GreA/GreB family elongation factor [Bacilli bacterium]MDD4809183.1 GreA/GreB family elongation factor [Bacilli bacterium]